MALDPLMASGLLMALGQPFTSISDNWRDEIALLHLWKCLSRTEQDEFIGNLANDPDVRSLLDSHVEDAIKHRHEGGGGDSRYPDRSPPSRGYITIPVSLCMCVKVSISE